MKKVLAIAAILAAAAYLLTTAHPREIEFDGMTFQLNRSHERRGDVLLEYTQDGAARAYARKLLFVATPRRGATGSVADGNWSYYVDHFDLNETEPGSGKFFSVSRTLNPEYSQGVYALWKPTSPRSFVFFREVVRTDDAEGIRRLRSAQDGNFLRLEPVYQRFSQ